MPDLHEPRLRGVATALPPQVVDAERAAATIERLFPDESPERIRALIARSGVAQRHIVPDLEEIVAGADFTARNDRFRPAALELAHEAATRALDRAGVAPDEIEVVVDVSCTGLSIPALDVPLAKGVGLRRDVQRVPISLSGCAAGALALGVATRFARAGSRVLVVAAEICSLTLAPGDTSRTNLVASLLFGDGAAACVITPEGDGPRLTHVGTRLLDDTEDLMGFRYGNDGMRLVLEPELPAALAERLPTAVHDFLRETGIAASELDLHLVHPGGKKILDAYERAFALPADGLFHSREALRRHGNLSSATILSVLGSALDAGALPAGARGFVIAIGPGLTLEMTRLERD